jgi:hypothetical protein
MQVYMRLAEISLNLLVVIAARTDAALGETLKDE